jgi:hypothetical protein
VHLGAICHVRHAGNMRHEGQAGGPSEALSPERARDPGAETIRADGQ